MPDGGKPYGRRQGDVGREPLHAVHVSAPYNKAGKTVASYMVSLVRTERFELCHTPRLRLLMIALALAI